MKKLSEQIKIIFHDWDPATSDTMTNINSTNWIDVKNVIRGRVIAIRTVGTGVVGNFGLYISAAATGTSAALVGSLTGSKGASGLANAANGSAAAPDIGRIVIDFTADDLSAALTDGRYICARGALNTGTDEFLVMYELEMSDAKASTFITANGEI
jgi:hypothetical protein